MYENYMLLLEEEAKIRNLKNRSILCYKNYVSYFLNYVDKDPQELSCQDVRDFLLAKKEDGLKATTLLNRKWCKRKGSLSQNQGCFFVCPISDSNLKNL